MAKKSKKKIVSRKSTGKIKAGGLYDGAYTNRQIPRTYWIGNKFATSYNSNVSDMDWRTLLSRGRDLYANLSCVGAAINELANISVGDSWKPIYTGKHEEWGKKATLFLNRWMEIGDIRGEPFSFQSGLRNASISVMRDGDVLCVLTRKGNFPMVQWIAADEIGSRNDELVVSSGLFEGYRIFNGVIVDDFGAVLGWKVLGEEGDGSKDIQIPYRDALLVCDPVWAKQLRGQTALASAIQPFQDYKEIVQAEIKSVKAASNYALQFYIPEEQQPAFNGEDGDNPYISQVDGSPTSTKSLTVETMQLGGESLIFKPDSGAKVEVLESDRPSQNTSKFLTDLVLRNCFSSLGVPSEFAFMLDSGGSTTRLVTGKVQRTIEHIQSQVIRPVWLRVIRYVISKAIKEGFLENSPGDIYDTWSWQPTYPREITVDNGRDTRADLDLYSKGIYNGNILAAQYGYDYATVLEQKAKEMALANELGAKYGVDPNLLVMATPNGNGSSVPVKEESPNKSQTNQNKTV